MDHEKRIVIKELNALLRGCEMGVSGYDKFARDAAEPVLKGKFESYKAEYAENANSIAQRITALGGKPKYNTGMAGVISDVSYAVRGSDGHEAPELLRSAHYGETKSIDATERALSAPGLDDESREVLRRQHRGARTRQEELIDLIRDFDLG
ncbi:hypothetical protein SDC9_68115 [bioreactor metagenome]|uniref:DUF2383 domain-containing protein n=1 Tax=bioreactor metagenome TaxID=1076179 RepID=A0A644XZK6_9ZZZZ